MTALAVWQRWPSARETPSSLIVSAATATAVATMTPRPEDVATPTDKTPAPDIASTSPATPVDAIRILRERLDRRERWRRIKTDDADARASLVAAARGGDDEAQVELANRLVVCPEKRTTEDTSVSAYVSAPKTDAKAKAEDDAFAELCAKWSGQTQSDEHDWRIWRDRSAVAGNGLAQMQRVLDDATLDADSRREALRRAWSTRDPGVADFVTALASGDRDYRTEQHLIGSPGFFFGGYLAQCQLGADCSRDGAAFQRWCRRGGNACDSAPSLDALFEQRLSPAQYRIAREQADALAHAFDGPPEDSPEGRSLLRTTDRTSTPDAER